MSIIQPRTGKSRHAEAMIALLQDWSSAEPVLKAMVGWGMATPEELKLFASQLGFTDAGHGGPLALADDALDASIQWFLQHPETRKAVVRHTLGYEGTTTKGVLRELRALWDEVITEPVRWTSAGEIRRLAAVARAVAREEMEVMQEAPGVH